MDNTTERTYPRDVWVLTPTFNVKKVTVVRRHLTYYYDDYGDETVDRKGYAIREMHATKADAIRHGRERINAQRAKLEKSMATLEKKLANLNKAEAE